MITNSIIPRAHRVFMIHIRSIHVKINDCIFLQFFPSDFIDLLNFLFSVKPRILRQLENDDVENGTSYKLNCSAYGDPALQYSWNINRRKNVPNAVLINGNKTLHINPVTIENEGTYTCVVTNVEGKASTTAKIMVFG